jgi:hypothetical protein
MKFFISFLILYQIQTWNNSARWHWEEATELTRENINEDQLCCITFGLAVLDISKDEYVETRVWGNVCLDARDRHEDDPGEEPYGKEYDAHYAEKADEEVCVHAIDDFDVPIVRFEDC